MSNTKIEVTEHNGRVTEACLYFALGPWPMKNWSWTPVYFTNLDEAKAVRAKIDALPSYEYQYEAYLLATLHVPITEEAIKEGIRCRADRERNTRKYVL